MRVNSYVARDRKAEDAAWVLWEAITDAMAVLKGTTVALVHVDADVADLALLTVLSRTAEALDREIARRMGCDA